MNRPVLFDPALLALLRCPETRQGLTVAPGEIIAKLEAVRQTGALRNRAGKVLAEPVTAGLLRADGAVFFPVSAGIPLLVIDDGVMLAPA